MKRKVYVVGHSTWYAMFLPMNYELTDTLSEADVVIFTGGEDVDPSIYRQDKVHPATYSNKERDLKELEVFNQIADNQLVIGICRGSQFLCAVNGGQIIQDVEHHAIHGTHKIYFTTPNMYEKDEIDFSNKNTYEITSTHHQMQYPYFLNRRDYNIIAIAKEGVIVPKEYGLSQYMLDTYGEPEIVLYHKEGKPKCLAIQGHPEIMNRNEPIIEKINELIETLLNNN